MRSVNLRCLWVFPFTAIRVSGAVHIGVGGWFRSHRSEWSRPHTVGVGYTVVHAAMYCSSSFTTKRYCSSFTKLYFSSFTNTKLYWCSSFTKR